MRISMGALSSYPFPVTPFTLLGGRVVNDPASEQPTADDCLPYQCGADPIEELPRMWCAFWGRSGARSCYDSVCEPFIDHIPYCQLPAPAQAPTPLIAIADEPAPQTIPVLTPQNIVQPLPSITDTLKPQPFPVPDTSLWCVLNAAIRDNPIIAGVVLVGAVALAWPKGRR